MTPDEACQRAKARSRVAARLVASALGPLALAGRASFSILKPASNATMAAPVTTDVFWNAKLQAGTLRVVVDPAGPATDVTNQFSVPRFEIVAGTASVGAQDAGSGATIAEATFLAAAKIFLSVDNGNAGIGFGSLGALPGDATFPNRGVEVAYPYAQFLAPTTDLKSNYSTTATWAISCMGFSGSPGQPGPGRCHLPIPLATTAGMLTITSNDQQNTAPLGSRAAVFTTVVR